MKGILTILIIFLSHFVFAQNDALEYERSSIVINNLIEELNPRLGDSIKTLVIYIPKTLHTTKKHYEQIVKELNLDVLTINGSHFYFNDRIMRSDIQENSLKTEVFQEIEPNLMKNISNYPDIEVFSIFSYKNGKQHKKWDIQILSSYKVKLLN